MASPTARRSRSMSRATLAVDMWSRIGPPRSAQARATARSDWIQTRSSARVTGNWNGVQKAATASSRVSKQRSGVLRMIPRGSKPTRSKRALTSSEYRNGPAPRTKSTPEPPGPPGLRNSEPILRLRVGGREPGQGEGDLLALGPVVVQRHHRGGALEGLEAFASAAPPVQPGHGRRAGARRRRRGGRGRGDREQGRRQHGHQGREHAPAEPVPVPRVRGLCQDGTPSGMHRPPPTGPAIGRILPASPASGSRPERRISTTYAGYCGCVLCRPHRPKPGELGIDRNRTVWQSPDRRHGGLLYVTVAVER